MKNFSVLLLMCLPLSLFAQQQWTSSSIIKFKKVTSCAISPDGRRVAYVVATPEMEGEKSEYVSHIWVALSDGSMNRQFTFGDKSCDSPQFSPDGKWLSFTSARNTEGKNQLFIMPIDGGEAQQITKLKGSVGIYKWAPDGIRIGFLMVEPLTEKEEKDKKEKRDPTVLGEFRNASMYTLSLNDKDAKNISRVKRLTPGTFHITSLNWSPDAKTIVFGHQVNASSNEWTTLDISLIPSDSGAVKPLVTATGSDDQPIFSPDGQWITYSSEGGKVTWAGNNHLYVVPVAGGNSRKLSPAPDGRPEPFSWSADGKNVYYIEPYKTSWVIYALPVDGKPARMITPAKGVYSSASLSKSGDMLACIYQEFTMPPQVVVMNVKDMKPKLLSNVNEEFAKRTHAKTDIISWKAKDGKYDIEGILFYPLNYQKGKSYPLIVNIHGGPGGVYAQNYMGTSSSFALHTFLEMGYAVLRPNPRGSSGYGVDFRFANVNDWGNGDYDDIMAGVDKVIADGVVHADSLCVMGWSYGGYMTSAIITKTNRFKAAVVGAGVTNLISFTGTADIPGFIPDFFGGEMWDRTDVYMKHSAIFNIKNATTPTLILHGERDMRVPASQGQELYLALKRLGVKTKMITYPRTAHGFQEPKLLQDAAERLIAWFNENCKSTNTKVQTAGRE